MRKIKNLNKISKLTFKEDICNHSKLYQMRLNNTK